MEFALLHSRTSLRVYLRPPCASPHNPIPPVTTLSSAQYKGMFNAWTAQFDKQYEDASETFRRYTIFKANTDRIHAHNTAGNSSYTMKMNQFGDLTTEEFEALYLVRKTGTGNRPAFSAPLFPIDDRVLFQTRANHSRVRDDPVSIDWRGRGAVTSVKNQGSCGACFTFSAAGAMEGAFAIAGLGLVDLSTQQMLDCADRRYGNAGCQGRGRLRARK